METFGIIAAVSLGIALICCVCIIAGGFVYERGLEAGRKEHHDANSVH
jgi:hypothetical protein